MAVNIEISFIIKQVSEDQSIQQELPSKIVYLIDWVLPIRSLFCSYQQAFTINFESTNVEFQRHFYPAFTTFS
jgi:hypothetical protein